MVVDIVESAMALNTSVKHKTIVKVLDSADLQTQCLCGFVGTIFSKETLVPSMQAAFKESDLHMGKFKRKKKK